MQVIPIRTAPIPPFMGGKNLHNYQPKEKNIEYIKKWEVKNDKKTI